MEKSEIVAALDEWTREASIDPRTNSPFVDAGLEIADYRSFLIGDTPRSEEPNGGSRSHMLDLRFTLAVQESRETIEPMLEQLRAAALADPSLGGRLPRAHRLELGAASIDQSDPQNRRGGPVVTLQAVIAEFDPGEPDAGTE